MKLYGRIVILWVLFCIIVFTIVGITDKTPDYDKMSACAGIEALMRQYEDGVDLEYANLSNWYIRNGCQQILYPNGL